MTLNYSCTAPLPQEGVGNFTNEPLFLEFSAYDLHLQSNSPCINAGRNAYATNSTDLDLNPRIAGGTVDIGAYEFQNPASIISYAWLKQYGFAINGSADYADSDNDQMNNWKEWRAGTNPTNASSVLRMLGPSSSVSGVVVRWQSVTNKTYYLQRSTNLSGAPLFLSFQSNLSGGAGFTSYVDTSAIGGTKALYRVGIQD